MYFACNEEFCDINVLLLRSSERKSQFRGTGQVAIFVKLITLSDLNLVIIWAMAQSAL